MNIGMESLKNLPVWEYLAKTLLWEQLSFVRDSRVLDFGSGTGITAAYLSSLGNTVTAIEPSAEMLEERVQEYEYTQLIGGEEILPTIPDTSMDMICCHNVLEYLPDKASVLREFARILKPGGILSVCKHNKPGRVMHMTVLLNRFDHAEELQNGKDGSSAQFGTIRYYENKDLQQMCPGFTVKAIHGLRTFWDLQQNQEIQKDPVWQEQMLSLERRCADLEPYRSIAFLHHILLQKNTTQGEGL